MQVVGGPAWMDSTRYGIAAKAAGNALRAEMYGPMLQSLLEERFRLKVHRETREGWVYFLSLTNNGPKLHATKEGTCASAANARTAVCGKPKVTRGPVVTFDITGTTIADFCSQLGMVMDGEVIDRTGIAGQFDIHLEYTLPNGSRTFVAGRTIEQQDQVPTSDQAAGPSISTALQQQLGLKLDPGKGRCRLSSWTTSNGQRLIDSNRNRFRITAPCHMTKHIGHQRIARVQ